MCSSTLLILWQRCLSIEEPDYRKKIWSFVVKVATGSSAPWLDELIEAEEFLGGVEGWREVGFLGAA